MSMGAWLLVMCIGLAIATVLTLMRMIIGPNILDRAVGADMLLVVAVAALGIYTAWTGTSYAIPAMLALTGLGFLGTLSVARFAGREAAADPSASDTPREDVGAPDGPADDASAGGSRRAGASTDAAGADAPLGVSTGDDDAAADALGGNALEPVRTEETL